MKPQMTPFADKKGRTLCVDMPEGDGMAAPSLLPEVLRLQLEVVDIHSGRLRLLPAAFWKALDPVLVQFWANVSGRWGIPTIELVTWLKDRIAGRRAIEIGAGLGDLGHHLGIPQTDSYAHCEDPAAGMLYERMGRQPPRPPPDVKKLDALNAVHALRPEVVIASWVTELGPGKPGDQTYYLGVRETAIVQAADYVLVGNLKVHGKKRIVALPHEEHAFPWLVSRASDPTGDRIWTWKRQKRR